MDDQEQTQQFPINPQLPRYKCHREVGAIKIKTVVHQNGPGDPLDNPAILIPEDEGYEPLRVSADFMRKHNPKDGDYYVACPDGHCRVRTAADFESGYTRI